MIVYFELWREKKKYLNFGWKPENPSDARLVQQDLNVANENKLRALFCRTSHKVLESINLDLTTLLLFSTSFFLRIAPFF